MNRLSTRFGRLIKSLCIAACLMPAAARGDDVVRVYFGTSTGNESKGIYTSTLNLKTGALSTPKLAVETKSPTFLAICPSGTKVFSVAEVDKAGAVSSFKVKPDGTLELINSQPSGGKGPCHVALTNEGKTLLVANYGSGSIASYQVAPDGELKPPATVIQHEGKSVDPKRQSGPHAHSVIPTADGRYVFAADLGLDKVLSYKIEPGSSKLTPNDPPSVSVAPSAGPRHFAIHPGQKHAFVINEMASTVTVFDFNADAGTLTPGQTISTLPPDFKGGNSTSEILVHPSGKFVYGANRGHDTIVAFSFDAASGKLTPVGHAPSGGNIPRNFGIDPTGQYLLTANQKSGTVGVLRIDQTTGMLTAVGEPIPLPAAMCVRFLPTSK